MLLFKILYNWIYVKKTVYNAILLKKSHITIPAVIDTFNECFVPYCGISMQ